MIKECIASCAMGQRKLEVCPSPHALSDGVHHWWGGWPGAYCLGCGTDDPNELCICGGCECPCHEEFWRAYEEACNDKTV